MMKKKIVVILIIFVIVLAILGLFLVSEKEPRARVFQPTQIEFTDKEIKDAVYSDYEYPEGFYKEDLGEDSLYYENTISIKPLGERKLERIELCTNDKKQALDWSESSSDNSAYYRNLIDEKENEKFFEFKRGDILSRVHKCSYLDRSTYRFGIGSVLGVFNQKPVTTENVKELIEYLWFIENYNFLGNKVLSSFTEGQENSVKHTIYETGRGTIYGEDWSSCDQLTLIKSVYVVDKISGEITFSREKVKTVQGQCH